MFQRAGRMYRLGYWMVSTITKQHTLFYSTHENITNIMNLNTFYQKRKLREHSGTVGSYYA